MGLAKLPSGFDMDSAQNEAAMQQRKINLPVGVIAALMPSEETTSSYMGLTREQKREILTHSMISGQQTALLRDPPAMQRTTENGFPRAD